MFREIYENIRGNDDPFGTKEKFPLGSEVSGQLLPDGITYFGKVVGYSKNTDDIYIESDKGKRLRLIGVSVNKVGE